MTILIAIIIDTIETVDDNLLFVARSVSIIEISWLTFLDNKVSEEQVFLDMPIESDFLKKLAVVDVSFMRLSNCNVSFPIPKMFDKLYDTS